MILPLRYHGLMAISGSMLLVFIIHLLFALSKAAESKDKVKVDWEPINLTNLLNYLAVHQPSTISHLPPTDSNSLTRRVNNKRPQISPNSFQAKRATIELDRRVEGEPVNKRPMLEAASNRSKSAAKEFYEVLNEESSIELKLSETELPCSSQNTKDSSFTTASSEGSVGEMGIGDESFISLTSMVVNNLPAVVTGATYIKSGIEKKQFIPISDSKEPMVDFSIPTDFSLDELVQSNTIGNSKPNPVKEQKSVIQASNTSLILQLFGHLFVKNQNGAFVGLRKNVEHNCQFKLELFETFYNVIVHLINNYDMDPIVGYKSIPIILEFIARTNSQKRDCLVDEIKFKEKMKNWALDKIALIKKTFCPQGESEQVYQEIVDYIRAIRMNPPKEWNGSYDWFDVWVTGYLRKYNNSMKFKRVRTTSSGSDGKPIVGEQMPVNFALQVDAKKAQYSRFNLYWSVCTEVKEVGCPTQLFNSFAATFSLFVKLGFSNRGAIELYAKEYRLLRAALDHIKRSQGDEKGLLAIQERLREVYNVFTNCYFASKAGRRFF